VLGQIRERLAFINVAPDNAEDEQSNPLVRGEGRYEFDDADGPVGAPILIACSQVNTSQRKPASVVSHAALDQPR
jgi:hypothetical protein